MNRRLIRKRISRSYDIKVHILLRYGLDEILNMKMTSRKARSIITELRRKLKYSKNIKNDNIWNGLKAMAKEFTNA